MTDTKEIRKIVLDHIIDFIDKDKKSILDMYELVDKLMDCTQENADDLAFKELGECEVCRGKGYSGADSTHVKYIDDKRVVVKPSRLEYVFCDCERGQALKHLILTNAAWVI